MRTTLLPLTAALMLGATACKPNLGSPPSLIDGPRILAVRGTPAEAAENQDVTYDILAVGPEGRIQSPSVTWALCHDPKPPSSANAVASSCLEIDDDSPTAMPTFTATMPDGSCKVFGPQPPDVMAGKPPLRPQDPDATGGFYQPVRARLVVGDVTETAFALERLKCHLANAPADITAMFNAMIKPNQNPTIASMTLDPAGVPFPLFTKGQAAIPEPPTVAPGTPLTLEVAWTDTTPETYPVFNLVTQMLETHRESLSVSWFATDGTFLHDRTGRGENEDDLTTDDVWTAPAVPVSADGVVHFWVLLRDIRGGVDFIETAVKVAQ
jgi:hypothetical protein